MSHPHPGHDDQDGQAGKEEYRPWYLEPNTPHPFKLSRKITLGKPESPAFRNLAIFPWDSESMTKLWNGTVYTPEIDVSWRKVVAEYWDAVAVTSDNSLYIFFTQQKRSALSVKIPEDDQKLLDTDTMCIAWALNIEVPLEPLVLFSRGSMLYSYSPTRLGLRSCIKGHGGAITSIAVHPTNPQLICTTSRDYTTRIYDLRLDADIPADSAARTTRARDEKVDNPVWPPNLKPSLAGAAHGLRLPVSEQEGYGKGRCIGVLTGGRSGGHQAAVLGAAFHPNLPLIATCGMDRAVKIWPVRVDSAIKIKREDKPLFSSTRVHRARVLSISWLQDDILLTHSAPAVMRKDPDDANAKETYLEPGELTIWQWLSMFRFFPIRAEEHSKASLRPISSDYQESSSFKIISTHAFPTVPSQLVAPRLSLFQCPYHDPLILLVYPKSTSFTLVNPRFMKPRPPYPFPQAVKDALLGVVPSPPPSPESRVGRGVPVGIPAEDAFSPFALPQTQVGARASAGEEEEEEEPEYMGRVSGPDGELDHNDDDDEDDEDNKGTPSKGKGKEKDDDGGAKDDDEDSEDEDEELQEITEVINRRPNIEVPPIRVGWFMGLETGAGQRDEGQRAMACAMGMSGRILVVVGTRGTVWVWRNDT